MRALIATLTAFILFAAMPVGYDWSTAKPLGGNAWLKPNKQMLWTTPFSKLWRSGTWPSRTASWARVMPAGTMRKRRKVASEWRCSAVPQTSRRIRRRSFNSFTSATTTLFLIFNNSQNASMHMAQQSCARSPISAAVASLMQATGCQLSDRHRSEKPCTAAFPRKWTRTTSNVS